MSKQLPKPKWVRRNYPFDKLKVADNHFESESLNYFKTAASTYFRGHPRKTYMTETVIRLADGEFSRNLNAKGTKGLLLTRLADK